MPSGAGSVALYEAAYACHADQVVPPSRETRIWYSPVPWALSANESDNVIAGLFVSVVLGVKSPVGGAVSSVSVGVDMPTGDRLPTTGSCWYALR